jgi:alpha-mannosidase
LKTVHLVCNAHIDPVWLWPWTAGLDEIINTCESVCNLLDRNRDVIFTRGEAWVYEQIGRIDPTLFRRIRHHVDAGRWEIVGGWYLQPDCNLPGEIGFRKQIELGREYFQRTFRQFPKVAYNVDSFGHTALLPRLMREAGQRYYVMMRPQEHEMTLPARLFHWRGYKGDPTVLTFRIPKAYQTCWGLKLDHIEAALTELPAGVNHTMSFIGIGDHGGGPTQEVIEWCRAHRDSIPGVQLEFSSPSRFFRAVEREARNAPIVTGELQHHAIGCYSVHRPAKLGVRRGEHALVQAEEALRMEPRLEKTFRANVDTAWRTLCFNHFHDALGGTCLPTAHAQLDAQLGSCVAATEEATAVSLRSAMCRLPADPHQRLVVANYTGADFDGWLEHEPWLEWTAWKSDWGLVDEKGQRVLHQVLPCEAVFGDSPRLLFKLKAKRGTYRVLRIVSGLRELVVKSKTTALADFSLTLAGSRRLRLSIAGGAQWLLPQLQLVTDETDTWAHGVDRFAGDVVGKVEWDSPQLAEDGPLLRAWLVAGQVGSSRVVAEIRRYYGESFVEMKLRVTWLETHRLLRLAWNPGEEISSREDGVSGGAIRRSSDGIERPVRDRTLLKLKNGASAAAVFPDTFSLSVTQQELRLTLLRSAVMAHHTPHDGVKSRRVISDQGTQEFTFRLYPDFSGNAEQLDRSARSLQTRPIVADLTKGMPLRALRGEVVATAWLRGGGSTATRFTSSGS